MVVALTRSYIKDGGSKIWLHKTLIYIYYIALKYTVILKITEFHYTTILFFSGGTFDFILNS